MVQVWCRFNQHPGPVPSTFILVALNALWSAVMQAALPALPSIARDLSVSAGDVQGVVTLYMAAVAVGQLVYGPLSDRYGRKRPLVAGLVIFLFGSVVCAWAPDLRTLLIGRFIQAAGACAGAVLSRAMVRDAFPGDQAAVKLGHVSMAMSVSPILATIGGGALIAWWGWRVPFIVELAAGIAVIAGVLRLKETNTRTIPLPSIAGMLRDFRILLLRPAFTGPALALSLTGAAFTAFVNMAPLVLEDVFHEPGHLLGKYFVLMPAGFICGAYASTRLTAKIGARHTAMIGCSASVFAGLAMLGCSLVPLSSPIPLFVAAGLITCTQGIMMAPAQVLALSTDPQRVGAASGLMGFMHMVLAAGAAQVTGMFYNHTALAPGIVALLCELGAFTAFGLAWLHHRRSGAKA